MCTSTMNLTEPCTQKFKTNNATHAHSEASNSARFSREGTVKADPICHWHPILHDPPTLLHVPALPSHLELSKFKAGLCLHIFAHGFSSFQDALSHFLVASSFKMLFQCWIPLYHFPLRRLCPSSRKLFPSRKLVWSGDHQRTTPNYDTASVFSWTLQFSMLGLLPNTEMVVFLCPLLPLDSGPLEPTSFHLCVPRNSL